MADPLRNILQGHLMVRISNRISLKLAGLIMAPIIMLVLPGQMLENENYSWDG